jgi:hypothetical protein
MSPAVLKGGGRRAWRAAVALTPFCLLAAAGCADPCGFRDYQADAVPSAQSGPVLSGYADVPPVRPVDDPRLAAEVGRSARTGRPLPAWPRAPRVELPGEPERPWAGAPRTRPAAQPEPEAGSPRPAEGGLGVGDELQVRVAAHPEFSGNCRVGRGGLLTIPVGGAFGPMLLAPEDFARSIGPAEGLSPEDLAGRIARALRPFVVRPPEVRVTVGARREG